MSTLELAANPHEFFETCNDAFAAFLRVRGCRHVDLFTITGPEGPTADNAFDDGPVKLAMSIGAYTARQDDAALARASADPHPHHTPSPRTRTFIRRQQRR